MTIRKTTKQDVEILMQLFAEARQYMKEQGNPNQWKNNRPTKERILQDIEEGNSYVCENETGEIVGTFYFSCNIEPTYSYIKNGAWIKEGPYGVIHRIATKRNQKGCGTFCIQWCYEQILNIRIDTHQDNVAMQYVLTKLGFQKCGIIFLENKEERIAFQKAE